MEVRNSLTKNRTQQKTIAQVIMSQQGQIAKALPRVMTPERFTRIALTAVNANPALQKCNQTSLLASLMNAAQLGLEPNTPLGQAYLIPYGGQCQFQIGYKGLIDLAYRSGEFKTITAEVVYANDTFEYELGLEPKLVHKPAMKDRGEQVWYYATFTLVNGGYGFKVMSREDMEAFRKKYSKANNSPWNTEFDAMAKKTVLKQALKYAPIKSDFALAISQDETVKKEVSEDMQRVQPEDIIDIEVEEPQGAQKTPVKPQKEKDEQVNQEKPKAQQKTKMKAIIQADEEDAGDEYL